MLFNSFPFLFLFLPLTVAGYTDDKGRAETNLQLSQKRADEVKAYLQSKGIAASRVEEKDLVDYFGPVYEDYRRNVPAFLPLPRVRDPEPQLDSKA